jgi:hypothetical protein
LEKFEAIPSIKFKIPGKPAIDVPLTGSDYNSVTFETTFIVEQSAEIMNALEQARCGPQNVKELFQLDTDIQVNVRVKEKILTESEKTLHRLENELDRININSSTREKIEAFCYSAIE